MREQIERICISVNTECNLSCKYCYFFNPENRVKKDTSLKSNDILTILDKIDEYSKNSFVKKDIKVNFVGSGEPLISWKDISLAVRSFNKKNNERVKFYIVTNGILINNKVASEMEELEIFPSVSLDGYKKIHDINRITSNRKGSFEKTMRGINILKDNGFTVAVNTTVTMELFKNIEPYIAFLLENNINKVTFDRLVDTPSYFDDMSYEQFYSFLSEFYKKLSFIDRDNLITVGNFESYRKNFIGRVDKVCTMFGSTCGAGTNFLIYMLKDVYPCGRMFGKDKWKLGDYEEDIETLQERMKDKLPVRTDCLICNVSAECYRDCILEYEEKDYTCSSRKEFIKNMKPKLKEV